MSGENSNFTELTAKKWAQTHSYGPGPVQIVNMVIFFSFFVIIATWKNE